MFTPQLVIGTLTVRSIHDPAIDRDALRCNCSKPADECKCEPMAWVGRHLETIGTGELTAKAGEKVSEFQIRVLRPTEAAHISSEGEQVEQAVRWYAKTIVSLDGCTDRQLLIDGVPLAVIVEIGSYARRANCEVSRPFSSGSLQAPSPSAAGSTDLSPRKPRRAGR